MQMMIGSNKTPQNEDSVTNPMTQKDTETAEIRSNLSKMKLPVIRKYLSYKDVRLAYTMDYSAPMSHIIPEDPVHKPLIVESVQMLKNCPTLPKKLKKIANADRKPETKFPAVNDANGFGIKKPVRRRGPKTQFKISKSVANIGKLEVALKEHIEKNKSLVSNSEEVIMHPTNKIQASMNTLKAVNKILPNKNLVHRAYGYDEDNLDRNHMTLEKIMLERLIKIKKRREMRDNTLKLENDNETPLQPEQNLAPEGGNKADL